jgi:signal transduction histidine kinase/CheY-like chemotaxis protein
VLYSFRGLRKDGKHIEVEVLGSITTFRGKPAIIGTMLDITERTNVELALRQKDAQLQQAQKMDAVGRLAGGIAHDFNNLLTTILGYAQLALDHTAPDDPRRAHLDEIVHSGNSAVRLTKQLLAFGRRQDLVVRPINVNEVLENMGQLLRRTLGEDIELSIHVASAPGVVEADPSQIEQVILNLAINARDAMPAGGNLHLETRPFTLSSSDHVPAPNMQPGNYALLVTRDTGCGMSDEIKAHVFEPFFTTKERGKNSGLGLATVYGIIQQCRGFIAFSSEEDRGTEFRIYLPRIETRAPKAADSTLPRGDETILLVEDEDTVRRLTGRMLTSLGYKIIEARDGREALNFYEQAKSPIRLVLTDVVMPHMGGPELIQRLQQQNSPCPAIFMSGFSDGRISGKNASTRHVPLLTKPFTREDLATTVRDTLDGTAAAHHHGNL